MKSTGLCLLLLAAVACAAPQSADELHIPMENDNNFPPEHNLEPEGSIIEGSGVGAIEEPIDVTVTTEAAASPLLEDVQSPISEDTLATVAETSEDSSCPKPCVCHIEGDSNNFIVDCSNYGLTAFPAPIDAKTTTLNVQNNKLTEIPKEVSLLKNLKVLNAENNSIMDLASGSISELPELTVLKLGNNRLIEYPKDLKNGFGLSKLEELDLGGNDMRTSLNRDIFSHFTALKTLTLPTASAELVEDLCTSLKDSLTTICTESCTKNSYDCPEAPSNMEDDLLNVILPGTIALSSAIEDNADPASSADGKTDSDKVTTTDVSETLSKSKSNVTPAVPEAGVDFQQNLRSAVNKVPDGISPMSTLVEIPKEVADDHKDVVVAVGATTSETKTGGVDKSIIGMIVAGMVLVVAGITIKKNWSSIKNRFSSSPRAANERPGANANGTAPEEVPLQEKSPA